MFGGGGPDQAAEAKRGDTEGERIILVEQRMRQIRCVGIGDQVVTRVGALGNNGIDKILWGRIWKAVTIVVLL